MAPAVEEAIPIWIRNRSRRKRPGTLTASRRVVARGQRDSEHRSDRDVNVEGAGMIGVPGTAKRLFGALREPESP